VNQGVNAARVDSGEDVEINQPQTLTPTDLYAFGKRDRPRSPRIEGFNLQPGQDTDLIPDVNGMVGPVDPPQGASTFGNPRLAPVRGHYHRLPKGTRLPVELDVKADGRDVGGPHTATHHTIYPKKPISPERFEQLFRQLPWQYEDRKRG